jgi:hypothetical protein
MATPHWMPVRPQIADGSAKVDRRRQEESLPICRWPRQPAIGRNGTHLGICSGRKKKAAKKPPQDHSIGKGLLEEAERDIVG